LAITPLVLARLNPRVVPLSANQRKLSGLLTIDVSAKPGLSPLENSVTTPAAVILPIDEDVVNQRLPSGSGGVMAFGEVTAYSTAVLADWSKRPIAFVVPPSVNQRLPSAPLAILFGLLPALRPAANSVVTPAGVILPIALLSPP